MNELELELKLTEFSEKIEKSNLIGKCKELAKNFGKGGKTSEEWACADYTLVKEDIEICYNVYMMGDEQIDINYEKKEVFKAKENNADKEHSVKCKNVFFDILKYKPGIWEYVIDELYEMSKTQIHEQKLKEIRQNFGGRIY